MMQNHTIDPQSCKGLGQICPFRRGTWAFPPGSNIYYWILFFVSGGPSPSRKTKGSMRHHQDPQRADMLLLNVSLSLFLSSQPPPLLRHTTKTMLRQHEPGNTKIKTTCTKKVQHLGTKSPVSNKKQYGKHKEERSDLYPQLLL